MLAGSNEADMDITPMIDVTFLLLIFFLVASRMTPGRDIDLPQARNGTAVTVRDAITLTVAPGPTAEALIQVYGGDGKDPSNLLLGTDVASQDQAIEQYVQDQLLANPTHRQVLIKAESAVRHREVARVARVASQADQLPLFVGVEELP